MHPETQGVPRPGLQKSLSPRTKSQLRGRALPLSRQRLIKAYAPPVSHTHARAYALLVIRYDVETIRKMVIKYKKLIEFNREDRPLLYPVEGRQCHKHDPVDRHRYPPLPGA